MNRYRLFCKLLTACISAALFIHATSHSQSLVSNPGFENGTASWVFYTSGGGTFSTEVQSGNRVGVVSISRAGSNIQLYQSGLVLESNKRYRLTFLAYSNTGHDVSLYVQKHGPPYTSYGLDGAVADLTTTWTSFSMEFTATGFSGTRNDGRLRIWLASTAVKNDKFYFDDVILTKITSDPPAITTQPVGVSVVEGQAASFSVVASGGTPLSFQWQKNGTNISGATASAYTTAPTTLADSGSAFRCVVSNSAGTVTSNSAVLRVTGTPPSISSHPHSQSVPIGQSVSFSVVASGSSPLNFQWQRNGAAIPQATNSIYTLATVTKADSGSVFRCVVSNSAGTITSNSALLTVYENPPVIVRQPSDQTVDDAQIATFSISASGTAQLFFQWQKNGVHLAGATDSVYRTQAVTLADSGAAFRCIVVNSVGADTSSIARLHVRGVRPTITAQPAGQLVGVGSPATFSVTATGSGVLAYQWQRNGADIPGATSPSFGIASVALSDSGARFRCIVRNAVGADTSSVAHLTVLLPPNVTSQPAPQTAREGETATFTIVASGSTPMSYQWQKNELNVAAETTAVCTFATVTMSDNGTRFRCIVVNPAGSDTSDAATLTVTGIPPSITTHPLTVTVLEGDSASFSVLAVGTAPLTYQWRRNGIAITGATGNRLTFAHATLVDSGIVLHCVVSNAYGHDTSNAAILSVDPAPPRIVVHPVMQTAVDGDSAVFTIQASGSQPISFQWQRNRIDIPGAVTSVHKIAHVQRSDSGSSFRCIVVNRAGSVVSDSAVLRVLSRRPVITQQPANVTASESDSVAFTVHASGSTPLLYQWQKNAVDIAGASDTSLILAHITLADNGSSFRCIVRNSAGTDTSAAAILTVQGIPPSVVLHPSNQSILEGQRATFVVRASGSMPLAYRWQKNLVTISGATDTAYTTPVSVLADSGTNFRCIISNSSGSVTSNSARLSVNGNPPVITSQPTNQNVVEGQPVLFSIRAAGSGTLTFAWRKNGVPIQGANDSIYQISSAACSDSGAVFCCVIANAFGTTTSSNAILRVSVLPPSITSHPTNVSVFETQTASFTVVATGSLPLQYQWQKDSGNIVGATSATYATPPVSRADNGRTFRCVVSNSAGTITSGSAVLTVLAAPPGITQEPRDTTLNEGQTAIFSVTVDGVPPITFQWQRDSMNIAGATNATYTTSPVVFADSGARFRCVVSNASGSASSRSAILSVRATPPAITTQPNSQSVIEGGAATFSIAASGSAPLSFQWSKKGIPIAGATNAVYTIASVPLADSGAAFRCIVSNRAGSVTSMQASLSVIPLSAITSRVVFAANAGGNAFVAPSDGTNYAADNSVSGGTAWNGGAISINGTVDDVLYQSERWGGFEYSIPVTNGEYQVVLKFAEVYWASAGKRLFHVAIEGTRVLTSFDIYKRVGKNVAFDTTFTTTVADNRLNVQFTPVADNAKLSAIVVRSAPSAIPPTIASHPSSLVVSPGDSASFSVSAVGSSPLLFQWQKNGVNIVGATDSTYTLTGITLSENGSVFRCVISNAFGTTTSNGATLSVGTFPPAITAHPSSQTISDGQAATFNIVASGSKPLSYQWQKNSASITGATSPSYTTSSMPFTDSGAVFRCIVSNPYGVATSNGAILSVSAVQPTIAAHPVNRTVNEGESAEFVVRATGSSPMRYQWQRNSSNIDGAIDSIYHTPAALLTDNGSSFRCVVSNPAGSCTSNAATLTVVKPAPYGSRVVFATNAGGGAYTSSVDSIAYSADTLFTGGGVWTGATVSINGTEDDKLFFSERWGTFGYTIPVADGKYLVTLRFAEIYWSERGKRVFNVSIEGNQVLANFDILGKVAKNTAYDTTFTADVSDGTLNISFVTVVDNSKVSAIVVRSIPAAVPPTIVTHPVSQTVWDMQPTTFSVVANGTAPLAYRWQKNGMAIVGADSAGYRIPAVSMADSGALFRCVVSNSLGTITSNSAALTVKRIAPTITSQPESLIIGPGTTATFSVRASGSRPLFFTWQKNAITVPGAADSTYSVVNAAAADSGALFRCIVSNGAGTITSAPALLRVGNIAPTITSHPLSVTINDGQATVFRARAVGSIPLAYRWQKNGVNIPGADSSTYTTPVASPADSGAAYRCIATNPFGADTSATAFLSVRRLPPCIVTHPTNQAVGLGETATFSVVASGSMPLQYQWQKNEVSVAGATNASYTTPPGTSTDNGSSFRCVVTNSAGSVASNAALWIVGGTPPAITTQPVAKTIAVGQRLAFSVVASGSEPFTYRWQKNGTDIPGATRSTYITPAVSLSDAGSAFRCIVANAAGSGTSNSAVLQVVNGSPSTLPFRQLVIDQNNPREPHCKALTDIDGDGFLDMLAASSTNYTEGLFWYKYPSWTKYNITPGSFSTSMKTGDIDGDGDMDAIIAKGDYYGYTLWWYENPRPTGDPRVGPWPEHFIGDANVHDVAVGDFNKDGKLDVLVRVSVTTVLFVQNNSGGWIKSTISSRPYEGTSVGDIDSDGDLDVVINGYWLENPLPSGNPSSGLWTERLVVSGWTEKAEVNIGDINGDDKPDILLAPSESADNRLSWFEAANPKTGPWTEHIIDNTVSYFHTLISADMNGDGQMDVVTAEMHQSNDPDEVSVYLNGGNGMSWSQHILSTTGSHNGQVGDIDRDGDLDIAGANWSDAAPNSAIVEMWENLTGSPVQSLDLWQRHVIDQSRPWRSLFIASDDVDGDARKDIVTGGWWYKNPGVPSGVWQRNTIGSPLNNMAAIHDFDGNGLPDILGTKGMDANANAEFAWAKNSGGGSFSIMNNIANGEGDFLQGVAIGRCTPAGPLEVALSWHESGHGVQMLKLPSNPVTGQWDWRRISSTSQNEQLSMGDIDRDGDSDLLLGTKWLRNDNSAWTEFTFFNPSGTGQTDPDRNRLADINSDGRLDAVVGYEAINISGKLAWYEQPGSPTGTWSEHIISTSVVGPMSIDVGDLDIDGDVDIVVGEHNYANPSTAKLIIFENSDGIGTTWTQHIVSTGDEHHDGAQLVDIDSDGDLDVMSIGWNHSLVLLYENKAKQSSAAAKLMTSLGNEGIQQLEVHCPTEFALRQNFPNPFNPFTTLAYQVPKEIFVSLKVFDMLGREVSRLIDEVKDAGEYTVRWDATNAASGVYFCRMRAGDFVDLKKMIVVR